MMRSMNTTQRKCIAKKVNLVGTIFALVTDGTTWEVWKQCHNYNQQCLGGMRRVWRYVQKGMTEAEARALYERRIKGSQP